MSYTDESISEKQESSTPSMMSQSRARRIKQRATAASIDTSEPVTPIHTSSNEHEEKDTKSINQAFINKIRENDTIARFQRNSSSLNSDNQTDGIILLVL